MERCIIKTQISKKEVIYSVGFFIIFVFTILIGTQTLTSGFHLVDDHQHFELYINKLNGVSMMDSIQKYVKKDFRLRFRPLYYPPRVFFSYITNGNIILLSVLKALEVIFTFEIVYIVLRKIHCNYFYSIMGCLTVLMGSMSAIWWKLGPQELTGTWILGVAIIFFLKARETQNRYYDTGFILFMVMASLYKEAYILMIPSFLFLYIVEIKPQNLSNVKETLQTIKNNIIRNRYAVVVLLLVLIIELYLILFVIGKDKIVYGAIKYDKNILFYFKTLINDVRLPLRIGQYILWIFGIIILYQKMFWQKVKKWYWQIILCFLIIIPQMIIYAETGIEERYVIPWIYGVVYFFIAVISQDKDLKEWKRKVYNIMIIMLSLFNLLLTIKEATVFADRGKSIQEMTQTVLNNTTEQSNIAVSFAPYRESEITMQSWGILNNRPNIYIQEKEKFISSDGDIKQLNEIDAIMFYNVTDRHYLYDPLIDFRDYKIINCGTMRVALRKP